MKYISSNFNEIAIVLAIILLWILFRQGKWTNPKLLGENPLSVTYQREYSPGIYGSGESIVPKILNKARLSEPFGKDDLDKFLALLSKVPMCDKGLFIGGNSADGWKVRIPTHIDSTPGRIVATWRISDHTTTTVMIREIVERGKTHTLCRIYNPTDPLPTENHIQEANNQISRALWHFIGTNRAMHSPGKQVFP